MKKGISLITLVITIVVLIILTGTILTKMNDNNNTEVINQYGKKAIIEDINIKIKKAKLKNEIQGISKITMEEIIPIIQEHGTFNNNILKLTTTKGIEIWLYEIMQIPLEEYATITYENSILTVQTELMNNGYRVQYTTDAGSSWSLYNNPVTISEESGIQIRLINEQGQVVSNRLKITGGVIEELDNISPIITIEPNGIGLAKNTQVTITVTDNNELANNNTYEYYLSTSSTTQAGGSWITYPNGTAFTIGTNLTGTYYLHVKEVYDTSGNTSGNVVSQSYTFDNTAPYSFTPTIGTVTQTSITINASTSDNNGQTVTYQYSINNGESWQEGNTFTDLTAGTTYSGIQVKAIDSVGNETPVQGITATTLSSEWSGTSSTAWYTNNTSATSYNIYTAEELAGLASLVNAGTTFSGKTINLMNDITIHKGTFSGATTTYYYTVDGTKSEVSTLIGTTLHPWISIGTETSQFEGTFNGNYNTISGMFFSGETSIGIFGYTSGNILNTIIDNSLSYQSANYDSVILCNVNYGLIDRIKVSNSFVAGLSYGAHSICNVSEGTVKNVGSNVYLYSKWVGFISGGNGTIVNCYSRGTFISSGSGFDGACSGFVNWSSSNVENAYIKVNFTTSTTFKGNVFASGEESPSATYVYANSDSGLSQWFYRGTPTLTNNIYYNSSTRALASSITINGTSCATLISALNAWVNANGTSTYSSWVEGTDGYPKFDWE